MRPQDADACLELLASQGYRFVIEARDIIACLDADSAASRQLQPDVSTFHRASA
jgi:hypothetical protein